MLVYTSEYLTNIRGHYHNKLVMAAPSWLLVLSYLSYPFHSSLALITVLVGGQERAKQVQKVQRDGEAMSMLRFDGRVALITGAGGGNQSTWTVGTFRASHSSQLLLYEGAALLGFVLN